MIKVLQVVGIMNRGGTETMIMNLYRHIDRTKIQFDFVQCFNTPAAYNDEISKLGGKIFYSPRFNGKNIVSYIQWWKQFYSEHKGEYVAVHGHLGGTASIYLKLAKNNGFYTIAHSHSIYGSRSVRETVYKVFSYPTRYIADHFFACSTGAAASRFGSAVANDVHKCNILKNAIDVDAFAFDNNTRDAVRQELNIADNYVIGHVGRFDEAKNQVYLVEMLPEILKKIPNAILLFVGDGVLRNNIENRARQMGVYGQVIFLGIRDDVERVVQGMDVFAFPSLYEGLGIVAIEAQAAGLPCICSEKVPSEVAVTPLYSSCSLESKEEWLDTIYRYHNMDSSRKEYARIVAEKGYCIQETCEYITDFYCKIAKSR